MIKNKKNDTVNTERRPDTIRETKPSRPEKPTADTIKKTHLDHRNTDDEASKKNKQLYNFRAQYVPNQAQKPNFGSGQDKFMSQEALAANAQENAFNLIRMQYLPLMNSMTQGTLILIQELPKNRP